MTGEAISVEDVNLYQFSYHYILPQTAPREGLVLQWPASALEQDLVQVGAEVVQRSAEMKLPRATGESTCCTDGIRKRKGNTQCHNSTDTRTATFSQSSVKIVFFDNSLPIFLKFAVCWESLYHCSITSVAAGSFHVCSHTLLQCLKLPGQFSLQNESVHIGEEIVLSAESMTVATVRNSISYKDMVPWYKNVCLTYLFL